MKDKILAWLFKSYAEKIKNDYAEALEVQLDAYKQTLDVRDVVRNRMKSINPNRPDDDSVLRNHLAGLSDEARIAFLGKAKEVTDNETFKICALSLLVDLQKSAGLESNDMVEVNFNRASINGVMLLEEQLDALTSMYIKEKDEIKTMSEEERLSAL